MTLAYSASVWADAMDAAASAAQVVAIVVGGIWAYFKFIKGRTFAKRAEVTVKGDVLPTEPPTLRVRATLRNAGLSKLPLRHQVVDVYGIYADASTANPIGTRDVQIGKHKKIFKAHGWVEAQEMISDEVLRLMPEPDPDLLAVRVECWVWGKRLKPGALHWTDSAIVPVAKQPSPVESSKRRRFLPWL